MRQLERLAIGREVDGGRVEKRASLRGLVAFPHARRPTRNPAEQPGGGAGLLKGLL